MHAVRSLTEASLWEEAPPVPADTRIIVQGCDEATEVTMHLTAAELSAIKRLAAAVTKASTDDCHPRIEVVA